VFSYQFPVVLVPVELETDAILFMLNIRIKLVELWLTRLLYVMYVEEEKEREKVLWAI